jgi:DNA-binding MarR family transcriptional regulator
MTSGSGASPQPEVHVPHRELIEESARFSRAFLRWLDGTAGRLTYPRLRVLEILHCQGPAKMKDLAGELEMTARNLTTLADSLEADALVRRVSHPTDRRATLLELTSTGIAAAECSLAPRLSEISALFDELPPAEQTQLRHSLATLVAAMETGLQPTVAPDVPTT